MEKYRKPVGCLADTPSSQLAPLQRATTDLRLPTRLFGRTPVVGSRTLKTIGSGRGWEYGEIPEAGWLFGRYAELSAGTASACDYRPATTDPAFWPQVGSR